MQSIVVESIEQSITIPYLTRLSPLDRNVRRGASEPQRAKSFVLNKGPTDKDGEFESKVSHSQSLFYSDSLVNASYFMKANARYKSSLWRLVSLKSVMHFSFSEGHSLQISYPPSGDRWDWRADLCRSKCQGLIGPRVNPRRNQHAIRYPKHATSAGAVQTCALALRFSCKCPIRNSSDVSIHMGI